MYKSFENILRESQLRETLYNKLVEALMDPLSFSEKLDNELISLGRETLPKKIFNISSEILKKYYNKDNTRDYDLGNGQNEKFKLETSQGEIVDATKENLRSYAKDVIWLSKYRRYFYNGETFSERGKALISGIINTGLECFLQKA